MKIIYASTLGCPYDDGKVVRPAAFENKNGFVEVLKKLISKTGTFMFITNRWESETNPSQPKDEVFNDYHYTNLEYAKATFDSFAKSGFKFKKLILVDSKYDGDFEKDLLGSDFVFVQNGHTPRGLKVLKKLKFEKYAKSFDGVVLFCGTAAKLPATKVLSTHHGNMKEFEIEKGLGLKDYSVRPHTDVSMKFVFNKKYRNRIKLIKKFSKSIPVIAMGADQFAVDDGEINFYGKNKMFLNGKAKNITLRNLSQLSQGNIAKTGKN